MYEYIHVCMYESLVCNITQPKGSLLCHVIDTKGAVLLLTFTNGFLFIVLCLLFSFKYPVELNQFSSTKKEAT